MSIGRSFLYEYSDSYLFDMIKDNKFKESKLFNDFDGININGISASELFEIILSKTNFYSKISKIGEYESINVRINTLYEMFNSLNNMGFGIEDIRDYLENINEEDIDIQYDAYVDNTDSVKILTIHKSKGLEYPFCYYADLDHRFNIKDADSLFVSSNKYGLIVPNVLSDNDNSILKLLFRRDYIRDEIDGFVKLLNDNFGEGKMSECIEYLLRLKKMA